MIESTPRFIQGHYAFTGSGFDAPTLVASITVSADKRAQPIYVRAGNTADALISLVLLRDGTPMRLFPIGAKSASHVQLALVEDIFPGSTLAIAVAAEPGVQGTAVVDFGLVEI